jgi:hypothetical protein
MIMVELLGPDAADHAQQREHQRSGHRMEQNEGRRVQAERDENPDREPGHQADQHAAGHPAAGDPQVQLQGRQRRHQNIDDIALNLGDHDGRRGIGEGILHDRHHDQARRQEDDELDPAGLAAGAAQRQREDGQEQKRHHHGRQKGLGVDFEEAAHLLYIEGPEAAPIDRAHESRRRRRRGLGRGRRRRRWRGAIHGASHKPGHPPVQAARPR